MKRYFEISTHALVITAFMALSFTGRLDAPSIAIFAAGVLWSLYRTIRQLPTLLGGRGTFYLSCAYIAFFVADNLILSRSFVTSTVHMVLFLELAKLHQKKSDRDYFYLIVLAFLMVLAAASLTIDLSFLITLLLFLIALVATLMSFEIVRSQRLHGNETGSGNGTLTGISVWASAWIVLLGTGLFFVIPRMGTGYFSRATVPPVLLSGFGDNVRLGEIGQIKLSSALVMRARRVSGRPSSGLKWRGIALDRFDGRSWQKTDINRDEIQPLDSGVYSIQPLEHASNGVRYDILLEPMATSTLFGPYHIRSVTNRQQAIVVDHDDSIYVRIQQQRRIQYEVLSEIPNRAESVHDAPPDNMDRYLQLPQKIDPRVIELAEKITKGATSPFEKASLIESYLRRNYLYTLNLTWTPGTQPLLTFLFETKNGHCEYFASAMTILARAAGIPARLINGFQMGEFNPIGSDYIVRESDAHSWTEAYFPGRGWMEFDATPPDVRATDTGIAAQFGRYRDALEMAWISYILVYDADTQTRLFRNAQDRVQSLQAGFRDETDKWSMRTKEFADWISSAFRRAGSIWFSLIVFVTAAGVAAVQQRRVLRTKWRIWNLRKGHGDADRDVVAHLFFSAARLAVRRKPSRMPSQTWREWASGVPDASRRSVVLRALAVFEKSLYGVEPVSNSDFSILENAIRELKG